MFRKENSIWLYIVAIIMMLGILGLLSIYLTPLLFGNSDKIFDPISKLPYPEMLINTNLDYLANINTNVGSFTVDLFEKSAPINVNNFVYLSHKGFYTETFFHRIVKDFLIQGGDRNTLTEDRNSYGFGHPGYFVKDEINWDSLDLSQTKRDELNRLGFSSASGIESHKLDRFTVAFANNGPNTNGSQFFIVVANFDDPRLEELTGKFTVFGKIIAGFDIIEKIKSIDTTDEIYKGEPKEKIIIKNIEIFSR